MYLSVGVSVGLSLPVPWRNREQQKRQLMQEPGERSPYRNNNKNGKKTLHW